MELYAFIGAVAAVVGSLFLLLASLGLIRMPDVYCRMQAGTKATTMGTLLVVLGLMLITPGDWTKLLLLGVFVLLTNPVSSHALSRSAHFQGVDPLDISLKGRELNGVDEYKPWKESRGFGGPVPGSAAEGGAES
jgi:multicomponent Na+:H+ antiporter subunit G